MNLILVHGINNQENSSESIIEDWLESIREAAGKDKEWAKKIKKHSMAPFYGKKLSQLSDKKLVEATAQGTASIKDNTQKVFEEAIQKLEAGDSISDIVSFFEYETPNSAVAMGKGIHKKWIKHAARVIQKLSPMNGKLALRGLKQAHVYLNRPSIAKEVKKIVKKTLITPGPKIVISHSLGTIVCYELLRELSKEGTPVKCPLFVTLGSPLGIDVVKKKFQRPRTKPTDTSRWVNAADEEDFIALEVELTTENFGPGVSRNISDVKNSYDDRHSVTDYLSNSDVVEEILNGLSEIGLS